MLEKLADGLYHRINLRPTQFVQLEKILEKVSKEGTVRLRKAVSKAEVRRGITNDMTRAERAQWAGDELLEPLGEIETLLEELEDWITQQGTTSFSATAQHPEVEDTCKELRLIVH